MTLWAQDLPRPWAVSHMRLWGASDGSVLTPSSPGFEHGEHPQVPAGTSLLVGDAEGPDAPGFWCLEAEEINPEAAHWLCVAVPSHHAVSQLVPPVTGRASAQCHPRGRAPRPVGTC